MLTGKPNFGVNLLCINFYTKLAQQTLGPGVIFHYDITVQFHLGHLSVAIDTLKYFAVLKIAQSTVCNVTRLAMLINGVILPRLIRFSL